MLIDRSRRSLALVSSLLIVFSSIGITACIGAEPESQDEQEVVGETSLAATIDYNIGGSVGTPVWQSTTAGRFLNFSSSPMRFSSCARGIFFAFGAWPALNSAGSRTSIITASLRLSSCTACSAPTSGTPLRRRLTKGQINMAPLAAAASTSQILFITNFIRPR